MEGHYILMKGKIHLEDISILNVNAANTRASKFLKELMLRIKSHIYI